MMIRVLVVDDSAFMRKAIAMMLESDPGITVIDTARDGQEAIDKVAALKPDVVTLDIEMPRMDGLTALRVIMEETPVPVLMISSLTKEGATATLAALEAGAVDFIPKESSTVSLAINQIRDDLIAKIRAIIASKRARPMAVRSRPQVSSDLSLGNFGAVVIGTSTGGPFALQQVLPALPADFPVPVLVVQHMPPHFTRSLAERVNGKSPLEVCEATNGDVVRAGKVYIAEGGKHMLFDRDGDTIRIRTSETPETLHRPSVDVMFNAALDVFDKPLAAVIMTGMGRDGLDGSTAIRDKGGYVISQDEASSVVYGMPRAVADAGVVDRVLSLEEIPGYLKRAAKRHAVAGEILC
jgi:two-component system, chemotaxis family, protein-glutamate methylesterase/glutaminase